MTQLGQYPAPSHAIAHLSDPHLLAGGKLQYGKVNPEAGLVAALERLGRIDPVPQALVFTGDLADEAEPEAYARLRELVEPVAERMGAQVVWTMGNHDAREPYARGLFGPDADPDVPQDRVHDVDGLRIIALDTSIPEYHHGELRPEQLVWLAELLAVPAPHGTVLAMHHPPIPIPMLPPAQIIELADQHLLADVVRGTDVRAILGGHFHFTSHSLFAGIPVSVASATCYTSDLTPADRYLSGVDGHQSVTMLHVYDDRVVHTIVPTTDAPEVDGYPLAVGPQVAALSGDDRRELLSRKGVDLAALVQDLGL